VSDDRPITVLHLVANRWWTGSAEPVIRLLLGLRARGHRVLLGLIPGDRFEQKAREAGLEPLADLSLEVRGNPVHALADLRRVRQAIRAEAVDVVHAHHSHDHWLGWLGRGRAGLVRSFHNARAARRDWPSTWLYRRTDALLAVSHEIEERLRRVGVPPARLSRVDGVVDLARFEAGDGAAIRAEFALGHAPVLGCVARLAPRRGHELLIRGFQQLQQLLRDVDKIRAESSDAVADIITSKQEKDIADMLSGIAQDGTAKELQDMRQMRQELRAEARISKEMAGTDTKAQEAEFLEYARTSASNTEFDSLVGLGAKTEAAPAAKEKAQALPE